MGGRMTNRRACFRQGAGQRPVSRWRLDNGAAARRFSVIYGRGGCGAMGSDRSALVRIGRFPRSSLGPRVRSDPPSGSLFGLPPAQVPQLVVQLPKLPALTSAERNGDSDECLRRESDPAGALRLRAVLEHKAPFGRVLVRPREGERPGQGRGPDD